VEVVGANPANSTLTAGDGSYSLQVPVGALFLRATAANYQTEEIGVVVPVAGSVDISLVSSAAVSQVAGALGITLDAAKGLFVVRFDNAMKAGGYGATLSAAHDPSFAFLNGAPQLSMTTLAGGDDNLIFPNTVAGTTTVTPLPPTGKTCTPEQSIAQWRVDPGVLTQISFACQ
jgi:hypothetical protein